MARVFVFSFFLFAFPLSAWASCPTSHRVQKILEFSQIKSEQISDWNSFDTSQIPQIIIDLSVSKRCGYLIFRTNLVETVEFPHELAGSRALWTYYPHPEKYPLPDKMKTGNIIHPGGIIGCCHSIQAIMPALTNTLDRYSWAFAYIHILPLWKSDYYESIRGIGNQFGIMQHEMFHYFYQNRLFEPEPWPNPKLVIKNLRSGDLQKKCYNLNLRTQNLLKEEVEALFMALESKSRKDLTFWSQKFIKKRQTRYNITPALRDYEKPYRSCRLAEAYSEYSEGVAEFLSDHAQIQVGSLTYDAWINQRKSNLKKTLLNGEARPTIEYDLGSLQLILLHKLVDDPLSFNLITKDLTGRSFETPLYSVIAEKLN